MKRCINSLGRSTRVARWFMASMVLWLVLASAALAAGKKKEEEAAPPSKSYVTSYITVILVLGGGLMAVLRPSSRADKIPDRRPDDDEE